MKITEKHICSWQLSQEEKEALCCVMNIMNSLIDSDLVKPLHEEFGFYLPETFDALTTIIEQDGKEIDI